VSGSRPSSCAAAQLGQAAPRTRMSAGQGGSALPVGSGRRFLLLMRHTERAFDRTNVSILLL